MNTGKDLSKEIRALEKKLVALEAISSDLDGHLVAGTLDSISLILKRLNNVQSFIDQIEIEIDKLEMRVSAIEHVGFRLRTGGL